MSEPLDVTAAGAAWMNAKTPDGYEAFTEEYGAELIAEVVRLRAALHGSEAGPQGAEWRKPMERNDVENTDPHRADVNTWLRSVGYVPTGNEMWGISWSARGGMGNTDLEFYPLHRHAEDQGWDAIIGCHASGENPRMIIGTCENVEDVQRIHETIRLMNGYKKPELDRLPRVEAGPQEAREEQDIRDWQNIEMSVMSECGKEYGAELVAMLRKLRAGSEAGVSARVLEWQPIETAPKDGSDVLLYAAYYGQPIVVGTFIAYRATGKGEIRGWCNAWDGDLIDAPPTHWMPLPASPAPPKEPK